MPWAKGQSGNPKGSISKGNSVAEVVRRVLTTKKKGEKLTREEKIIEKAAELAAEGSAPHMHFLFDRGYGKPQESMQLSGGLSVYEQGASEPRYDRTVLLEAMRRLSGGTKK